MALARGAKDPLRHHGSEFELCGVSLGIWTTRRRNKLLLCLPHLKTFVVLLVTSGQRFLQADNALERAWAAANTRFEWDKHNPLSLPSLPGLSPNRAVVALELRWSDIQGVDYFNPLHQDGRLVLEASLITKRVFSSLHSARHHYATLSRRVALAPFAAAAQQGKVASAGPANGSVSVVAEAAPASQVPVPPPADDLAHPQGSGHVHTTVPNSECRAPQAGPLGVRGESDSGSDTTACGSLTQANGSWSEPPPGGGRLAVKARASSHPGTPGYCTPAHSPRSSLTDVCGGSAWPSPLATPPACPEPTCDYTPPAALPHARLGALHKSTSSLPVSRTALLGLLDSGAPTSRAQHTGATTASADCTAPFQPPSSDSAEDPRPHTQQPSSTAAGPPLPLPPRAQSPVSSQVGVCPALEFRSRTLIIFFRDQDLPASLSRFVKSDVRILKLYESGLPAWAIFLPSYGLLYRPWMRRVTWALFTAISIMSMAMGFYDLYKNVPVVRQAMAALSERLFPAHLLFEWLERHVTFRLSILLTWMFSKSPLFLSFIRSLRVLLGLLGQVLAPVASQLRVALAPLVSLLSWLGSGLAALLSPAASLGAALGQHVAHMASDVAGVCRLVLGPPTRALWSLLVLLASAVGSLAGMGRALLWGPGTLMAQLAAVVTTQLVTLRAVAVSVGQVLRSMLPAARATGTTVAAAAAAARAAAPAAPSSWSLFARAGQEAVVLLEFVRTTLYRCVKALQAVVNGLAALALAGVRHRVSLLMQLRQYLSQKPQTRYLPPVVQELIQPAPSTTHGDDALAAAAALLDLAGLPVDEEGGTGDGDEISVTSPVSEVLPGELLIPQGPVRPEWQHPVSHGLRQRRVLGHGRQEMDWQVAGRMARGQDWLDGVDAAQPFIDTRDHQRRDAAPEGDKQEVHCVMRANGAEGSGEGIHDVHPRSPVKSMEGMQVLRQA